MDNNIANFTSKRTNFFKTQEEVCYLIASEITPLDYRVDLTSKGCSLALDYGDERITLATETGVAKNFTSIREIAAAVKSLGGHSFKVQIGDFLSSPAAANVKIVAPEPFLTDLSFPASSIKRADKSNWISIANNLLPELADTFQQLQINSDESYLVHEINLPLQTRRMVAKIRLFLLSRGDVSRHNFTQYLSMCPPWFLDRDFSDLRLNARLAGVFSGEKITTIRHLAILGGHALAAIPKIGKGSLLKLSHTLFDAFNLAIKSAPVEMASTQSDPGRVQGAGVVGEIQQSLAVLTAIQKDVFIRRKGLMCESLTLAEISKTLSVSRERVRQIESKAKEILLPLPLWDEIAGKLLLAVHSQKTPLSLHDLAALDPWFQDVCEISDAFKEMAIDFFGSRVYIVSIDGTDYLTDMPQKCWHDLVKDGAQAIKNMVQDKPCEEHCVDILSQIWKNKVNQVGQALFGLYTKDVFHRFFWTMENGKTHLMGSGKSMDDLVRAILENSDVEMEMSQLLQKVQAIRHFKNENNVRAAAQNVGCLFGKSKFGLRKHLIIPASQIENIRRTVEEIVASGASNRQWHSSELIDLLERQGVSLPPEFEEHKMNIILEDSERLVYLGRMIWGRANAFEKDTSERLTLRDAAIAILQQHGHPMSNMEIRRKVEESRGTSSNFQIYPGGRLVRQGKGVWGLKEWDRA